MKVSAKEFLYNFEKKLWKSPNKLLPSLDAAIYKHVVLGLIFLRYVSNALIWEEESL